MISALNSPDFCTIFIDFLKNYAYFANSSKDKPINPLEKGKFNAIKTQIGAKTGKANS